MHKRLLALGGLDGTDRIQHGIGQGALGIFVAGRIILALGDVHRLDLPVHRVDRVALASPDDSFLDRTGMGELHVEGLGELALVGWWSGRIAVCSGNDHGTG